jgi:hypothetical protein
VRDKGRSRQGTSFVQVTISPRAPDGSNRPFSEFVQDQLKTMPRRVIMPAAADALNRTAQRAKTVGKRRIATLSKVPVSLVNEQLYVSPARAKTGRLRVSLSYYHRGVSLPRLGARKAKESYLRGESGKGRSRSGSMVTQKGIRAGAHFFPGGFLATSSKNNQLHGFRRVSKERYPLKVLKVELKGTDQLAGLFRNFSRGFMQRRFQQQVAWRTKSMSWSKAAQGG